MGGFLLIFIFFVTLSSLARTPEGWTPANNGGFRKNRIFDP
jgi:uncharacterized membrane protein YkgB